MSRLVSAYFTSSSTWTAPAGVTKVYLLGHGGGAGGSGAGQFASAQVRCPGGNSTVPYLVCVDVTPNTTYTITIGAGGTGGSPSNSLTSNGGTGGNTTFGTLHTFYGASRGIGKTLPGGTSPVPLDYDIGHTGLAPKYGTGTFSPQIVSNGFITITQSFGLDSAISGGYGGLSGAPGYIGSVGGTPGNGVNPGAGTNGGNASGFGAGGGGAGTGSTSNGTGGNGAPGQLWVIWVE